MMKITGINHITLATLNLRRAITFYCETLGLERVATWDNGAYLLAGDLWLCLSYDINTKSKPHEEYTHIALTIEHKDFSALKQVITHKNIPIWKENKSEGESLYILDPDYNKLEIHASNLQNRIHAIRNNPYPGMVLNEFVINKL